MCFKIVSNSGLQTRYQKETVVLGFLLRLLADWFDHPYGLAGQVVTTYSLAYTTYCKAQNESQDVAEGVSSSEVLRNIKGQLQICRQLITDVLLFFQRHLQAHQELADQFQTFFDQWRRLPNESLPTLASEWKTLIEGLEAAWSVHLRPVADQHRTDAIRRLSAKIALKASMMRSFGLMDPVPVVSPAQIAVCQSEVEQQKAIHLFGDQNLSTILTLKSQFIDAQFAQFRRQVSLLYQRLPSLTIRRRAYRLQQSLLVIDAWADHLRVFLSHRTDQSIFTGLHQIVIQKESFWKACLNAQRPVIVTLALNQTWKAYVQQTRDPKPDFLQYLKTRKQGQLAEVAVTESAFYAPYARLSRIAARVALTITQDANYQRGRLLSMLMSHLDNQLADPLPLRLQEAVNHTGGAIGLGSALAVSTWIGYHHAGIGFAQRLIRHQLGGWLGLARWVDPNWMSNIDPVVESIATAIPEQHRWMLNKMLDATACDDIGLIQKDRLLQWGLGFSINMGLFGLAAPLPAAMGYCAATGLSELASRSTSWCVKRAGFSRFVQETTGFLSGMVTYSTAYRLGFEYAYQHLSLPSSAQATSKLTPSEAAKILGVDERASAREVRKKFREQASDLHPDQTGSSDASAYRLFCRAREVLLKHL